MTYIRVFGMELAFEHTEHSDFTFHDESPIYYGFQIGKLYITYNKTKESGFVFESRGWCLTLVAPSPREKSVQAL